MPLYTVRLPDGSTDTRRSDRVYTHAIVVDSRPWGDESQGVWVLGYAGNEDLGRKRINSLREGRSKEARRLEGAKFTLVPVEKTSNPGGEVMTKRKNPIILSAEDYDALRPKDRIFLKTSGGFSAGEREFEVGRKSYSKKHKVESKRLYPVERGQPVRRGIAPWTLYKRDNGYVSLAHGDMGIAIHSWRRPLKEVEVREIKQQLKGPFKVTWEGEENIYFTDGTGREYFFQIRRRSGSERSLQGPGCEGCRSGRLRLQPRIHRIRADQEAEVLAMAQPTKANVRHFMRRQLHTRGLKF